MTLIEKIQKSPEAVTFQETIAHIDEHYLFSPTRFTNGDTVNEAGQNNGSCKIFSFAKIQNLNKEQTLHLFGDFYRIDVLQDPNGSGHQNIRNFMQTDWKGIHFDQQALKLK
ncbi:HopJ type III effector protein [Echinicola sp. CAU 1574]|uniref:HopJ type III effector protein n=1 Tax=Echinicola arenosa TaxID=2774144 RepID=A0ABR9AF06_9BACT|nr:HopJ type III effector protein [Echinicola arenosa]MBD8487246.1 HopJ type III effector protein [Echinicola arenosa]